MPKLSERDRLADLEQRQRKLADELDQARRAVRARYASAIGEMPVEQLTERDFRDILQQAIQKGGAAAIAALKGLPDRPG